VVAERTRRTRDRVITGNGPVRTRALSRSDAEPTTPQNEKPEATEERPNWHVHLELRSDELVALHRMGFTSSALAWREGMPEWQPVGQGPGGTTSVRRDRKSDRPMRPDGTRAPQPKRVRTDSKPPAAVEAVRTPMSGPPPPPPPVVRSREQRATDLPPASDGLPADARLDALARHATSSAPPPPPPPPPTDLAQSGSVPRPTAPTARLEAVAAQPASSIPPLAVDRESVTRPPPPDGSVWLRLSAIVALSAGIGAAVSAVLWDFRSDDVTAAAESRPLIGVATPGAAKPNAEPNRVPPPCPVGNGESSSKTAESSSDTPRVSLETLPLERGGRARSEAAASRSEASEQRVQSRGRTTRTESVKLASMPLERPASKSKPPGPVNRAALAQAASQAASAATSCDSGPRRGRAAVTFAPSGNVMSVNLIQSFGDVAVNGCVLRAFGRVRVPPFTGDPVEVRKTVSW
jgi:hypothetical protein